MVEHVQGEQEEVEYTEQGKDENIEQSQVEYTGQGQDENTEQSQVEYTGQDQVENTEQGQVENAVNKVKLKMLKVGIREGRLIKLQKSDESMKIDNDCTNGVGNTGNVKKGLI